jgi:hypothetical protein
MWIEMGMAMGKVSGMGMGMREKIFNPFLDKY